MLTTAVNKCSGTKWSSVIVPAGCKVQCLVCCTVTLGMHLFFTEAKTSYPMQAHPPPVDVGTETDGQLQQAEAALDAQRAQSHALKRRILELQVSELCT